MIVRDATFSTSLTMSTLLTSTGNLIRRNKREKRREKREKRKEKREKREERKKRKGKLERERKIIFQRRKGKKGENILLK